MGHKRSLESVLDHIDQMRSEGADLPTSDEVWKDIKDICVKSIFSGIHFIDHVYRTAKPTDIENSLCF